MLEKAYGRVTEEAVRSYLFFESKLPGDVRTEFLSMVAVELLTPIASVAPSTLSDDEISAKLRTALERVVKRIKRAVKRIGSQRLLGEALDVGRNAGITELRLDLSRAVKLLSAAEKRILGMRTSGFTLHEIASAVGMSTTEVHRRMKAIAAQLRRSLSGYDP